MAKMLALLYHSKTKVTKKHNKHIFFTSWW